MNYAAVYHKSSDNYCYPLNDTELIINIQTGYDVDKVFIHHGDPFSKGILGGNWQWSGTKEEITNKKRLANHQWWSIIIKPEFKRVKYYFELISNNMSYYYYEEGFLTKEQMEMPGKLDQFFIFPWMNSCDISKTPKWVNDTVWYQIFPERFCNGNSSINPPNTLPWTNGSVKGQDFYGGDLYGIKNKLHYLKALGITGIYLTPIFESSSTHKYNTFNYMKIDPNFGDDKIFKELVDEAHSLGIKIMLDGVFNHCGHLFPLWVDVKEKGPESEYFDWFMVNKWPFDQTSYDTRDGKFYSFAFSSFMPKMNTNNPDVIKYFVSICEYWVKNFGIDGLRLDVANEVSHQFCKILNKKMKEINPDFYILGEIWHDSISWLRGDEFDAVMNYPLVSAISKFWIDKTFTKDSFEYMINKCYTMYMNQSNDVMFNLLDSHDTNRLITRVGNLDIFYQQLAILFTMPGSPCIYYGTEIALEGDYDPDCRRCMPWDDIENGKYNDRISVIRELIRLRKSDGAFKSNEIQFTNSYKNDRVIEYLKTDASGRRICITLNCSDVDILVDSTNHVVFKHLCSGKILEPNGVVIYQVDSF